MLVRPHQAPRTAAQRAPETIVANEKDPASDFSLVAAARIARPADCLTPPGSPHSLSWVFVPPPGCQYVFSLSYVAPAMPQSYALSVRGGGSGGAGPPLLDVADGRVVSGDAFVAGPVDEPLVVNFTSYGQGAACCGKERARGRRKHCGMAGGGLLVVGRRAPDSDSPLLWAFSSPPPLHIAQPLSRCSTTKTASRAPSGRAAPRRRMCSSTSASSAR